jgi:ATP-dependent helicase/DNAse subunit B
LALEVVETPELGFDPAQLGTMYHAILEKTFKHVLDPNDNKAIIAHLRSSASSVFEVAPEKYGFKPSALWEAEKDEMLARLEKTIAALVDDGQGWRPHKFEQIFGKKGIPALELETEFGTIRISGFIDRIDIQDNNLRIIDYKTGSGDYPRQDLLNGNILQLPVYGLAAQQALQLGVTTHGYYWRIHAAKPSSFRLESFEHQGMIGPETAFEVAVESIKNIVNNVRKCRFPPVPTKGVCPTYCPAGSWCWRYKPSRF